MEIVPPAGQTVTASATGAAQANNCTITGTAGKITYITGFQITGGGATAASGIAVTLTGCLGGTLNYTVFVPTIASNFGVQPLVVAFNPPLPSATVGGNVVLNVPSFGAGNLSASASIEGFQY